jgi:hypothetical protein
MKMKGYIFCLNCSVLFYSQGINVNYIKLTNLVL